MPAHYAQANGRKAKILCSHPLNTQNTGEVEKTIYGNRFVKNVCEFNVRSRGSDLTNTKKHFKTRSLDTSTGHIFLKISSNKIVCRIWLLHNMNHSGNPEF